MVTRDLARASYRTFACDDTDASVLKALFKDKFSSFRTTHQDFVSSNPMKANKGYVYEQVVFILLGNLVTLCDH